jgi:exopolysaccharide production protein ExoZ
MSESYLAIQYLRAVAAVMVVMHHALNPHPWLFNPIEGFSGFARGVDVFFVISGFIMATVGVKDTPGNFIKKRLIRVVPIYWLVTLLATVLVARKYGLDMALVERAGQSLLFIPHLDAHGQVFPVVPAGWTLNYEVLFYSVFALSLLASKPLRCAGPVLVALVLLGWVWQPEGVISKTFTSPVLLEFVAGMALGHFRHRLCAWPVIGWVSVPSWALLLSSGHWAQSLVAATGIVAGALAMERRLPEWSFGKVLGDASFFLYLSHHFVLILLIKCWKSLSLTGYWQFGTLFAACVVVSVVVGLLGHRWLEKPLTRRLTHQWKIPSRRVALIT